MMVSRKLASIRAILRKARQVKDPLTELLTSVRQCDTNSQLVQLRAYHARDMPKELQEWCLAVCRENLAALYERVWSWSDAKKRQQLTSAASRFLVAHEATAARAPVAYVNYRFEVEEGEAVLYCYELQVVRAAQSRGLGRMMMELAERIAWAAGMSKVMLTVFSENATAVAFYRKLGYVLDESSPDYLHGSSSAGAGSSFNPGDGGVSGSQSDSAGAGAGYHIMSKRAPLEAQQAQQAQAEQQVPQGEVELEQLRQQEYEHPVSPQPPQEQGSSKRQRTETADARQQDRSTAGYQVPCVYDVDMAAAHAAAAPGPQDQLELVGLAEGSCLELHASSSVPDVTAPMAVPAVLALSAAVTEATVTVDAGASAAGNVGSTVGPLARLKIVAEEEEAGLRVAEAATAGRGEGAYAGAMGGDTTMLVAGLADAAAE